MIQGRTPEITIKFNSLPELPTEGKKVTLEILAENGIKVKAELNRKTLKKQVAKISEYENWIGAMSGKIKSIAPGGIVELESAGIQVFEAKAKDSEAKSASQAGRSSQAQEVSQTIDSKQSEKEAKIQKLIATATSPRDKAFYQDLLQKAIAERKTAQVESSKSVNSSEVAKSEKAHSSEPNSAEKKDEKESSTEKKQNEKPIFQAVGIIEGEVESIDNKLKVSIGAESYDLKFVPGHKKRQWSKLKQEIEKKGSSQKTLIVYPQANLNKKGEVQIAFALSKVESSSEIEKRWELMAGEFKLAGLWQYPPKGNTPCITIRRNWEQGFVNYLEKVDSKQQAYILRPNHLPVEWSDSPTEAFRVSESALAEGKKADFVTVKGVFEPEENKFKVLEVLEEPTQSIPRYLKAPKPSTSGVND